MLGDGSIGSPRDCMAGSHDQVRWWLLAAQKVLPHDRDGKFGNQKLRQAYLVAPLLPKDHPRPFARSNLHALGHVGYTLAELRRPFGLQKIFSVVEQQ
jgi:hypothetical protein